MRYNDIATLLFHTPLEDLLRRADALRRRHHGDHVYVRGLLEFGNVCICNCRYCGLRHANTRLPRYRLSPRDILSIAETIAASGADTIVLQSGEDPSLPATALAPLISTIRERTGLAVTLSVGERPRADYALWKDAGATRYLLKHETADPDLYARLHPGRTLAERLRCLDDLIDLGYATGSGFIVGLPGQTPEILVKDILLARALGVKMCGVGPFIPQADTPLREAPPGSVALTLRVMAVLRLALPHAYLPATTALATLDPVAGQRDGLRAGGNVLMPSFTPDKYRGNYRIYDNKACIRLEEVKEAITRAGRTHSLR